MTNAMSNVGRRQKSVQSEEEKMFDFLRMGKKDITRRGFKLKVSIRTQRRMKKDKILDLFASIAGKGKVKIPRARFISRYKEFQEAIDPFLAKNRIKHKMQML